MTLVVEFPGQNQCYIFVNQCCQCRFISQVIGLGFSNLWSPKDVEAVEWLKYQPNKTVCKKGW